MVGINDPKLRERLLREKAIKLCRITEQSKKQSKVFDAPTGQTSSIETVKKTSPTVETEKTEDWRKIVRCKFCGSAHNRGNCPAYEDTCHKCHGRNHCARCCLRSKTNIEERIRHLEVESNEENGSLEGLYIEAIQGSSGRNIQSDLLVNDTHVTFKLDTGAECNIMSMHLASELRARIEPTSILLKYFGGYQLDTVGTRILPTRVNGAKDSIPLECYVIKDNVSPRLGLESCLALELITLNGKIEQIGLNNINEVQQTPAILNDFRDVFEGLGCVEGEYTIKLKANSQPTIQPQRNVPLRLRDKLKATLDDLEKKDVMYPGHGSLSMILHSPKLTQF